MLDIAREFADKVNSMPKYVVTTTLDELERDNSTPIKGAFHRHPARPHRPRCDRRRLRLDRRLTARAQAARSGWEPVSQRGRRWGDG
jgi:hypothetical protein